MNRASSIRWRRIESPGWEVAALDTVETGHELTGHAEFWDHSGPVTLDYAIAADQMWRTVRAVVTGQAGRLPVRIEVTTGEDGQWYQGGRLVPGVAGCRDVDLGFSPATNLLAIRRLRLAVGEEASVRAAWLPFPDLSLQPLDQVYHRVSPEQYRYAAPAHHFDMVLTVSAEGFVVEYPGLWIQEGAGDDRRG